MIIWLDQTTLKKIYVDHLKEALYDHKIVTDLKDASDAEIAIMMPGFAKPEILDQMPKLKLIKLLTAGYDGVDLKMILSRNIKIAYAKDVFSIQIAEDVIAKILFFNRKLNIYDKQMKSHHWSFVSIEHEIHGSTIGIIGAGSIGDEVAKRIKAFETYIIGYRRTKLHGTHYDEMVYDTSGLQSLIQRSDYIILTIPLTKDTFHLINSKTIALMKPNAVIINVARGPIIDQDALIDALNNLKIRGAALDVTTPEPLPESHPLWTAKNIWITPHQASASPKMHERLMEEVIVTIKKYINLEELDNLIAQ